MLMCSKCGAERQDNNRNYLCNRCSAEYCRAWRAKRQAARGLKPGEKRRKVRPIRVEGDVAYVPLTRGLEAKIDTDCIDLISKWNWRAQSDRSGPYAARTHTQDGVSKMMMMHRVILPVPQNKQVDHINGDRLDNRLANLREATPSENSRNRRVGRNSKSGIKGVRWCPVLSKWISWITLNKRRTYLGSFHKIEDAAAAYARASKALHGEFGRTS